MSKVREIKKYIWIVVLIGGILTLVSIFTPVSYYIRSNYEGYNWMWGLSYFHMEGFGSDINFSLFENPIRFYLPIFLSELIPAILIFLSSIMLIIMANRLRVDRTHIKDIENKLIGWGVTLILAPIIYMIAVNLTINALYDYEGYPFNFTLFGSTNPGFAFIAPFIGGALVLVGGIVSKTMITRDEAIFAQDKGVIITKTPIQPMTNRTTRDTKYIWAIALTAGILTLISFFTPALYIDTLQVEEHFWMWGLHYGSIPGYGSDTSLIPLEEPSKYMVPIFLSGIIPAILIFFSSIVLIAMANSIRTGRKDLKIAENKLIGWGFTLIVASVIYIIGIDITMKDLFEYILYDPWDPYYAIPDVWDIYEPGFAIIGPFIGAALAIIAGVASKTIKPREEPIRIAEIKDFITKTAPAPAPTIGQINFCPECGQKLIQKGSKFCVNCGFELKF